MNGSLNTIFPPRLLPFYGNSSLDTQSSEATYYISAELASLTAAAPTPTPPKPRSLLAKSKVQQKKKETSIAQYMEAAKNFPNYLHSAVCAICHP